MARYIEVSREDASNVYLDVTHIDRVELSARHYGYDQYGIFVEFYQHGQFIGVHEREHESSRDAKHWLETKLGFEFL